MDTVISEFPSSSVLKAVLEGFIDGILILTNKGEWVHANGCARRICSQLSKGITQGDRVPKEIWSACKCLIDSLQLYPNRLVTIEDEIHTSESESYRVRAQWLSLNVGEEPCVLVTLEDRLHSIRSSAIAEAQRYHLTPRELEVWVRYRVGCSYKDIATELVISHNTVKKHMKSIHAKRQPVAS
jgi:DNA-binding CsgD family transcriptional regulator